MVDHASVPASKLTGAVLDNELFVLAKLGRIRVRRHRPLEATAGTPKAVTLSREADGWYAIVSCADVPAQPLIPVGQETGIDVGLKVFPVTAQGVVFENPRYYRKAEAYLAKCAKRVARRKKGSKRRKKAVVLLAKAHQTVARQRLDFHHKTALALVRQYEAICHEELRVANMVKNHHLAKSIADASWSAFLGILSFKAACAGREVVAVDPTYTSQAWQACSGCGALVVKGLSVRWHACPECGTSLHRDEHAARNMQGRGQRLRGLAGLPMGTNREAPSLSGWGACHHQVRGRSSVVWQMRMHCSSHTHG